MATLSGLDVLQNESFRRISGKRIGLVCHQASLDLQGRHAVDVLREAESAAGFRLCALFGPQHGIGGHTQDNMVEWEGGLDRRTGLPLYSLYGSRREPADEWLAGLDLLVFDLQEVGSRYYTFLWTLALCMRACVRNRLPLLVLDRPNPIGGRSVEGTVLEPAFSSFVGLHPLPMRHGMTIGEVAAYLAAEHYRDCPLEIVPMDGWRRDMEWEATGRLWAMPSPNMPTPDTALAYPGGCLLEGTNLSEGRGTTRPFETVGAPWLDGHDWAEALAGYELPGALLRPVEFQPTFQKHAGRHCGGIFLHVRDRTRFEPVRTYLALLHSAIRLSGENFTWNPPPYEYEHDKLPFDILAGNDWLRPALESGSPLEEILSRCREECLAFEPVRRRALLYD